MNAGEAEARGTSIGRDGPNDAARANAFGAFVPSLALVEAQHAAGPYARGEHLSLAFDEPSVGRLMAHRWEAGTREDGRDDAGIAQRTAIAVPDVLEVAVLRGDAPFEKGERVFLSFVDPGVVRIARVDGDAGAARRRDAVQRYAEPAPAAFATDGGRDARTSGACDDDAIAPGSRTETTGGTGRFTSDGGDAAEPERATGGASGIRSSAVWDSARAGRIAIVAERLLAVERIGWYRHVLAVRLLLAQRLTAGEDAAVSDAYARLREAVAATLGEPLLLAMLPSFAVTPAWLDRIEDATTARAVADVLAAIAPHLALAFDVELPEHDEHAYGSVRAEDLRAAAGSISAVLPLFIPWRSRDEMLEAACTAYRNAALDVFGRSARAADPVRLRRSGEEHPLLDERLVAVVTALRTRSARRAA